MTTTVTVSINGRYRAHVKQDELPWVTVEGNYEGSPNPDGKHHFTMRHNSSNKFLINEESIDQKAQDATAQGAVLEVGLSQSSPGLESAKKIVAGIEKGEQDKPNEGGLR